MRKTLLIAAITVAFLLSGCSYRDCAFSKIEAPQSAYDQAAKDMIESIFAQRFNVKFGVAGKPVMKVRVDAENAVRYTVVIETQCDDNNVAVGKTTTRTHNSKKALAEAVEDAVEKYIWEFPCRHSNTCAVDNI